MARPTKYNNEMLQKAKDYVSGFIELEREGKVEKVPSVQGLSIELEVSEKTIYNWSGQEGNEEFLQTLESLKSLQALILINKGLTNDFNPTIAKLMLHNHGYSEKQEIESTNKHTHDINDFTGLTDEQIRERIQRRGK